jgi:hypothetical protein
MKAFLLPIGWAWWLVKWSLLWGFGLCLLCFVSGAIFGRRLVGKEERPR